MTHEMVLAGRKPLHSVIPYTFSKARERSDRALGSEENCGCVLLIDSEMAGPIGQKTWWDDRGHMRERPREG